MRVTIDASDFMSKIDSLADYAQGFVEEIKESGEPVIANSLSRVAVEAGYKFIDSMARTHYDQLHHVYEWYQTGDPGARLFQLDRRARGKSVVNISARFLPSTQPMLNSPNHVFWNKAQVMESGQSVDIYPINGPYLKYPWGYSFSGGRAGSWVTSSHSYVPSPGGPATTHGFQKTFEAFAEYFSSSFGKGESGVLDKLKNLGQYFKGNLRNPSRSAGRSAAQRFLRDLENVNVFDE